MSRGFLLDSSIGGRVASGGWIGYIDLVKGRTNKPLVGWVAQLAKTIDGCPFLNFREIACWGFEKTMEAHVKAKNLLDELIRKNRVRPDNGSEFEYK